MAPPHSEAGCGQLRSPSPFPPPIHVNNRIRNHLRKIQAPVGSLVAVGAIMMSVEECRAGVRSYLYGVGMIPVSIDVSEHWNGIGMGW